MPGSDNSQLWKYAGMVTQIFVSILIALYFGIKIDKWMSTSIPVFAWALPLLVVIGIIIKVLKDTGPKKK